jgi:hypothetical protein
MSQLQLSLLGTPVVKHGERTLTFSTRKTLSESFWPELDA